MKSSWSKFLINALVIFLILGLGYYYRDALGVVFQGLQNKLLPCQQPIMYSIESIDPRFGLTEEEFLDDVIKAEKIWESSINRQLFEYSPSGSLKINLIYDYRQQATEELQKLGIVIHEDKSTYQELETKYKTLVESYNEKKEYLNNLVADYEKTRSDFEKDVKYWNSRGGAPKNEYEALEKREAEINDQIEKINQTQDSLNDLVKTINSVATVLNKLIADLNLQVSTYNAIGASAGEEFSEGEYVRDANSERINIFQFNDRSSLVRVIAHELGHALGLEHVDSPGSIMYRLNQGTDQSLTLSDIAALKNICKIE